MVNTILAIHNRERAAVGVPPLAWSDKLAADAKTEAEYLVTVGKLTHEGCGSCNGSGNLAEGGTGISTAQLVQFWVNEKAKWHSGTILTEANWYPTGHYTQMIWKTTTHIGCATASGGNVYLSCHYSPPGNYMGQSPY
ncbi:MAG TPA: CAP domain-containing protein [Candidatus Bathyarchaeia archaeon]|nr:CAP domain-containing protein [Candidatus Bathyarchaeia archaeon]